MSKNGQQVKGCKMQLGQSPREILKRISIAIPACKGQMPKFFPDLQLEWHATSINGTEIERKAALQKVVQWVGLSRIPVVHGHAGGRCTCSCNHQAP